MRSSPVLVKNSLAGCKEKKSEHGNGAHDNAERAKSLGEQRRKSMNLSFSVAAFRRGGLFVLWQEKIGRNVQKITQLLDLISRKRSLASEKLRHATAPT
jgi:hypothetical protein